jgi:hypothetical protein
MALLDKINPFYWVNKVIDKRINHKLRGVNNSMEFNPLLTEMKAVTDDELMTRRLVENSVWYRGIDQDLRYFYLKDAANFKRNGISPDSLNYFWYRSDNNYRKIHSGVPQLISEKMVDLITGNGYEIKIESGSNEEALNERLQYILKDNNFNKLIQEAIETESWSGGVAFKLSINPLITDVPIIEIVQPENYTNVVQSGRILKDIFFTYYKHENMQYRLKEIYGVNEEGAYIDYLLEKLITDEQLKESKWVETSINDIPQTEGLEMITFKGYFNKLSLYKPNKTPNSEFRGTVFGESDYSGSYGAFDALDEILSTWIQEFRDGKLNKYFPEEFAIKDRKGNTSVSDAFLKDHILYEAGPGEEQDKRIEYKQGDLRIEKHVESWKKWLEVVLNNAGLSPLTVGVTGLEAINAGENSQKEREKVSIRTRNKKVELWTEFLEDFMTTVLELDMIYNTLSEDGDAIVDDFDMNITFADYILKSKQDRTEEVKQGIEGKSWDIRTAVEYVHDDMTEQEIDEIVEKIYLENNIKTQEEKDEFMENNPLFNGEVNDTVTDTTEEENQEE